MGLQAGWATMWGEHDHGLGKYLTANIPEEGGGPSKNYIQKVFFLYIYIYKQDDKFIVHMSCRMDSAHATDHLASCAYQEQYSNL